MRRGVAVPLSTRAQIRPAVVRSQVTVKCCYIAASPNLSLSAKCPYRTLGVHHNANEEEIKGAFRKKAKMMHPDVSKDPVAERAFMECQLAYKLLLNSEARAKYDKTLLPCKSNALAYLNDRSIARHGISPTRFSSRVAYPGRREVRSNLLSLVIQIRACVSCLEREYLGKDAIRRGLGAAMAHAAPSHLSMSGVQSSAVVVDSECGEHEGCEPWIYYAAQTVEEEKKAAAASRRR
ncbi:hypothetical protein VaNZ11_011448 [Volvox africanus]|uniref:J domain-containing protein n=1 Tax=Volvox africanus TaxID=51714 RepID=A0ABQ5SCK2_9CHLO|nr:hypothetical protein VaNZ11_011448 [Volvox africanus]